MICNDFYKPYCNYQLQHLSFQTYENRKYCISKHFLPTYKNKELDQISSDDINAIYDAMKASGFAQNSIYSVRAALLSFFKLAAEYRYFNPSDNPVKNARLVRRITDFSPR